MQDAPIILIGHSYGGLVMKAAVCLAFNDDAFRQVRDAIVGLIFLGTPHFGSELAWPTAKLAGFFGTVFASSDLLLRSMTLEDVHLNELHNQFLNVCQQEGDELDLWRNSSRFYELEPTMLLGLFSLGRVVGTNSASGGLSTSRGAALSKDHSGLNKFVSPKDDAFVEICRAIENHRNSRRGQRYQVKVERPVLIRASMTIVNGAHQCHDQDTNAIDGSEKFARSTEFLDWKRIGDISCRAKHFLYVKLAPGEQSPLHFVVQSFAADLQRPGPGTCLFDLAFHITGLPTGNAVRASEVLRHLLAQVVIANEAHGPANDRVSNLDTGKRKRLLQALELSQSLEQTEYWDLISSLLSKDVHRPMLLVVDRADLIDGRDRNEFLKELTRVWERCQPEDRLRVLISSRPCFGELEDPFLRDATVFDPHREFFVGMNGIRDIAENPRQDQVNVGLANTGNWIYDHPTFMKFCNTASSEMICVTGYGGGGKSTLTKRLLEDARLKYSTPAFEDMMAPMTARELRLKQGIPDHKSTLKVVAAFFYQHDANVSTRTGLTGDGAEHINMLCSLLYQIFWQVPTLFSCWKAQLSDSTQPQHWSFDDLQAIFHSLRDHLDTPLVIHLYIDALNESGSETHYSGNCPTRRKIMSLFHNLRASDRAKVTWKILLSTRELGEDMVGIVPGTMIRITDHNHRDVDACIEHAMEKIRNECQVHQPGFPSYAIDAFEVSLKQRAKGIILWVRVIQDLIVNRLRGYELTSAELDDLVLDASSDMHNLYTRMVVELSRNQRHHVVKAWLQWGALSLESLRVPEYKDAVAMSDMGIVSQPTYEKFRKYRREPNHEHATRNLLVSKCGGFLDLKKVSSSATLSLAKKVQSLEWAEYDFVVEPGHHTVTAFLSTIAAGPFRILEHEAHFEIVEKSISYLQLLVERVPRTNTDMASAVVGYLEDLPFLPYVLANLPRHLAFINRTEHAKRSVCHENIMKLFRSKPSGTPTACLLRLWACGLSKSGPDQDFWCSCAKATAGNDEDYVSSLETLVETATQLAAANALRSILAAGLLTEKSVATVQVLKTLILSALSSDDPRMENVLLFLLPKHDATGHALRAAYRTILHEALSRQISPTGIARLIRAGADVNHRNKLQTSPLHIAAASGNTEVAKLLLCNGAEVDARDTSDKTPLHVAVSERHEMVVKLLLDHKASVDARTIHEDSPMSLCRGIMGYEAESIRRLLMDRGAQFASSAIRKQEGWNTIPIRPSQCLVERPVLNEIENAIKRLSESQDQLGVVAVCGLGGAGKTQLAIQTALDWLKTRPSSSVFWIDGSSESHIQSSCQYLVQLVRPPGYDPKQPPENWVTSWLTWLVSERSGSWLLLVDNIDDKQLLVPLMNQLSRGLLLLTSRDSSVVAVPHPPEHHVEAVTIGVAVFAEEEAVQMLVQRQTQSDAACVSSQELEDIKVLVKQLGYLPLAIAQAGAFMAKTNISARNCSALLEDSVGSKEQLLDEEFNEHRGPQNLPNAVTKTWAVSFSEIESRSPHSIQILAMIGVLDPQGCPEHLLLSMSADRDFDASMQTLYDFSFVIPQQNGSVRTHPLVHEAIRQYLDQQQTLEYWKIRALGLVSDALAQLTASHNWLASREILPHAETVLEYARQLLRHSEDDRSTVQADRDCWELRLDLLSNMSQYHKAASVLRRAKSLLEEAIRVAGIMNLTDTERTLDLQTDCSAILALLGDLTSAEELEERTLEQRELLPNPGQDGIVRSITNLASIYRAGGKLTDAKDLAIRALGIRRESEKDSENGCELQATQDAMLELAATYIALGDFVQAETLQARVNEVRSRILGSSHSLTLQGRNELAATYGMQGRYRDAETILTSAVAEGLRDHGILQHKSTWSSTANLAVVYRSQQRWEEAASLDQKLLDVVPESHPLNLVLKENLAVTLREWGYQTKSQQKLQESLSLIREVVVARIDTVGTDAPDTLTASLLEAQTRWYLHDEDMALRMMESIYDSRVKSYGLEHPDSLTTLLMIAEFKEDTQPWNIREVIDIQKSVWKTRQRILGLEHPDTLEVEVRMNATSRKLRFEGVSRSNSAQNINYGPGFQYRDIESSRQFNKMYTSGQSRMRNGDIYGGRYVFDD